MNALDIVNLEGKERIFFKPNIPEALKQNALMKICPGLSPDDEILILIDDSLLGDGKAGIVITNRRFYFRESFDNSYYREFKDIEYFSAKKLKGFLKAEATLLINGEESYNFAVTSLDSANVICNELNKYIKELYFQERTASGKNQANVAAIASAVALDAQTTAEPEQGFIAKSVNEFIEEKSIEKTQELIVEKIQSLANSKTDEANESEAEEIEDEYD